MNDASDTIQEFSSPQGFHFCGVKQSVLDAAKRRGRVYEWRNKRELNWYIGDRIPSISAKDFTATFKRCFDDIQSVCGLAFTQVFSSSEADFKILTRPIDGDGGTLAEHELPVGDDRPLRGWWDTQEKWSVAYPPGKLVYLPGVALHELLHGCGLDHTEKVRTLMNPYYDYKVHKIGDWEAKQLVDRYGQPIRPPKDDEDDDPKAGKELSLVFDGVAYKPVIVFPK